MNKKLIAMIAAALVVGGGAYWYFWIREPAEPVEDPGVVTTDVSAEGEKTEEDLNEYYKEIYDNAITNAAEAGGRNAVTIVAEYGVTRENADELLTQLVIEGKITFQEMLDVDTFLETGSLVGTSTETAGEIPRTPDNPNGCSAERLAKYPDDALPLDEYLAKYDTNGDGHADEEELLNGGYFDNDPEHKAAAEEWLRYRKENWVPGGSTSEYVIAYCEYVTEDGRAVAEMDADEEQEWLANGGIEELKRHGLRWD